MKTIFRLYQGLIFTALLCASSVAWGQMVTSNSYRNGYENQAVQHKFPNKWNQMRNGLSDELKDMDTFNDEEASFNYGGREIQAAHTYIDTLYVQKGQPVTLMLPTSYYQGQWYGYANSAQKYQRWYNFITDGSFEVKNRVGGAPYDILTQPTSRAAYRFSNGYVSGDELMASSSRVHSSVFYYPTEEQFDLWDIDNGDAGNDQYIVACDISGYTDFTRDFSTASVNSSFTNGFIEPTLSLRVLYFIVGVDDNMSQTDLASSPDWFKKSYGRLFAEAYQGGDGEGKKFLEEYNITFPCNHISQWSDEIVALSKGAEFYGGGSLTATVSSTENRITLVGASDDELTLSGDTRIIAFRKTGVNAHSSWSVEDNTKATIIVTKGKFNIAKFNLTFKEETRLLTQHQLDKIDKGEAVGEDWNYTFRTPTFLKNNYQLLTSLTFNYDSRASENIPGARSEYYPFPLDWGFSSYAFYDGSTSRYFSGASNYSEYGSQPFAEWGNYAITTDYIGYGDKVPNLIHNPVDETLGGRETGYFLFVDASDLPGKIVSLPFNENLCPGAELFISAWVKSAGERNKADAAMLFSIYGINKDGGRHVLYQQSTGQIQTTTWLSNGEEYTNANGYGAGQNDWYQVYFSFINDGSHTDEFVSYEVRIDNNCSSTDGGDFYLDDIYVYIAQPTADVKQLEYTCANERTPLNISLDWNRLMERIGVDEENLSDGQIEGIDFCFIDETVYNAARAAGDNALEALEASIRNIGNSAVTGDGTTTDPDDPQSANLQTATLYFYCKFDDNKPYDSDFDFDAQGNRIYNLAINNRIVVDGVGQHGFYKKGTEEEDDRALSVDFYADLSPNRPYLMLILDHDPSRTEVDLEDFAAMMDDPCGIQSRFYVTSETLLKVNGEVVDTQQDYCEGQVFNFTAQVRVPTGSYDPETGLEEFEVLNEGVYFDWFFGTEDEFTTGHPDYNDYSLETALIDFREWYPTAVDLDGVIPHEQEPGVRPALTQDEIDLIRFYLQGQGDEGGLNSPLVLYRENLDIKILAEGLELVVQPISTVKPSSVDDEAWEKVCWGYIPLVLEANGAAPELHAGFNNIEYPADDFNPNLRIGLAQMAATNERNTIRVELREASFVDPAAGELGVITRVNENEPDYSRIYLIASDDPQYESYFTSTNFSEFTLPIGRLAELHAEKYGTTSEYNDYARVYFDLSEQTLDDGTSFQFTPHEGYSYTFSVYFEEKLEQSGGTVVGSCRGTFPVTMKVVPEYVVWNDKQAGVDAGVQTGNWHNDGNWRRATATDLKMTTGYEEYPESEGYDGRAFTPMLFTKVIMPRDSKVELYAAGLVNGARYGWVSNRPDRIGVPTDAIQYDLMTYEHDNGSMETEPFRVSLLDQIHFEPGAEMLHPEYLYYNKAYVDYELDGGKWYTLATPLQEVVAGDFYTGTEGTEGSEYFTDITFGTGNSRFAPSFYQRAWKNSTTTVTLQNNDGLPRNVAVAGNWSALYNDVADPYEAGKGFSLKVQDVPAGTAKVQVRLPKADASYSYYNVEGGAGGDNTAVTRETEKVGKLLVSGMFNRSVEPNYDWQSAQQQPVEVTLSESANGQYFLVGNPFMAQLDVQAFLQENSDVLEPKFWAVDDGVQDVAVTSAEGETSWTSTDGSAAGSLLIAPLRSFFVKKLETVTGEVKVTFTGEMQRLSEAAGTATAATDVLRMVATTADGRSSRAAVAFRSTASAGYAEGEEAELFLDSNLGDVPTVYTVGGTQALSINATPAGARIPVGIYGADDDEVTLRFEGVEACPAAELYDAETQTRTALYDGMEVEVAANEAGRYYILTGDGTDGSTPEPGEGVSVYSVKSGEIVVASVTTPLQTVKVYTTDGVLAAEERPEGGRTCRVAVNPDKIYIVHVQDAEGRTVTAKLHVR